MSRRHTLLAGAAVVALAPAHALAANATLAQGNDPYYKQAQAAAAHPDRAPQHEPRQEL